MSQGQKRELHVERWLRAQEHRHLSSSKAGSLGESRVALLSPTLFLLHLGIHLWQGGLFLCSSVQTKAHWE